MGGLPSPLRIIPDVVRDQILITVPSAATARQAIELMSEHQIGAVLVVDGDALEGIFTERDVMIRIVAARLDPDHTTVVSVATRHPETLRPDSTARQALRLMHHGNFRHLPVLDMGRLVGIVSIRDLYRTVLRAMEDDLITMAGKLLRG